MSEDTIREALLESPWFAGLPVEAIDRLGAAAELRHMAANTRIYEQGLPTTEIVGVLSARVRVSISSPNGHEFSLIDREPGAWFGEPGLVNDDNRIIDARLLGSSEAVVIPRDVVLAVGEEFPILYRNLFRYHQEVLRGTHEILAGMLFYPLRSRVAGRLHYLLAEHGVRVEEGVLLDIKVSQADFARFAMGSRQRVNKIFRDWNERGLVVMREDYLLIRDPDELEREIALFE